MKGQSLVSNIDDLILVNQSQSKKIKFLQQQKQTYQKHIKDLRYSLNLNKQSLSLLASQHKKQALFKLNQQNQHLHKKLQILYEQALGFTGRLLIQEQLKNEEKKFYNQRLVDYENTMSQLRKYLQDKQDSFSAIVMRLRKYQDLNQLMLTAKVQERYKKDLKQNPIPRIIKQLSEERDKYKEIYDQMKINLEDFTILRNCLEDSKSYLELRQIYTTMRSNQDPHKYQQRQKMDDNFLTLIEKTKNTTASSFVQNLSPKNSMNNNTNNNGNNNTNNNMNNGNNNNNGGSSPLRSPLKSSGNILSANVAPNKQLIRLLKKQKLNNQILQEALNDAIEKNQELIEENNCVIQSNMEYQRTIEKLQSKIILLQAQLSMYQKSLRWKKNWKSKCDLSKPKLNWLGQFQVRGDQANIHLQSLQSDMSRLSQFLMVCIPGHHQTMKKSLSATQFRIDDNLVETSIIEQDDLEVQQI